MNFLNEYVGLYFYSTVFQGNMALAALVGVFAIYKLEMISNEQRNKSNWIIDYFRDQIRKLVGENDIPFEYTDEIDLIAKIKIKAEGEGDKSKDWKRVYRCTEGGDYMVRWEERKKLDTKKKAFIQNLKPPLIFLLAISGIALLLLPWASWTNHNMPILEIILIMAVALSDIYALYLTGKLFIDVMKE